MDLGTSEDCLAKSTHGAVQIITAMALFKITQKLHLITIGKVVRQEKTYFYKGNLLLNWVSSLCRAHVSSFFFILQHHHHVSSAFCPFSQLHSVLSLSFFFSCFLLFLVLSNNNKWCSAFVMRMGRWWIVLWQDFRGFTQSLCNFILFITNVFTACRLKWMKVTKST